MLSMFEYEYGLHTMECVWTKRQRGGGLNEHGASSAAASGATEVRQCCGGSPLQCLH